MTTNKTHPCVQTYRKAKRDTLKELRERIRRAKLFQYSLHPRAFLSPSDRLMVALTPDFIIKAEIEWLRGIK